LKSPLSLFYELSPLRNFPLLNRQKPPTRSFLAQALRRDIFHPHSFFSCSLKNLQLPFLASTITFLSEGPFPSGRISHRENLDDSLQIQLLTDPGFLLCSLHALTTHRITLESSQKRVRSKNHHLRAFLQRHLYFPSTANQSSFAPLITLQRFEL